MDKIVILLPTYNENENIEQMIETLENDIFPKIKNYKMDILVIDDSSTDGTIEIVKEKIKKYKNLRISIGEKKGLGAAFKRGLIFAIEKMNADVIIKMDSDFQHNPKNILDLIDKYNEGYNYVIGSRYGKGGSVPKEWGLLRKFLSKYGGLYTRIILFFPKIHMVSDVSSGFILASVKKVLNRINFDQLSSGFYYSQQLIFQVVNLGIKIAGIPINFETRKKNETKMPFHSVIGTLISMPILRITGKKRLKR